MIDNKLSLRDTISRNQLFGLTCLLIGISQLPLGFILADISNQSLSLFVSGSGGWLLISVGINLLRGKGAFQSVHPDNERIEWLIAALSFLLAMGVIAATGITLSSY